MTASTSLRRDAAARPRAKLLTIRQTAEILSVCDETVRRLVAAEQLRALGVGRSLRVSDNDLQVYPASCR